MSKSHDMTSRGCLYCCMCLTRWIPVVFIAALLGWSYYAYAIELCFCKWLLFIASCCRPVSCLFNVLLSLVQIDSWVQRSFYFVFYHVVLVLFAWSYYQTIFTPVKRPPEDVIWELTR